MWDREMMQMCSQNGRAELKGRSCDLVEPYVPLVKPKRSDKEMELSLGKNFGKEISWDFWVVKQLGCFFLIYKSWDFGGRIFGW